VFGLRARPTAVRTVGAAGAHLRVRFGPGVEAIGFGMGASLDRCGGEVEAAVTVGFDEWGGVRRVQLKLRDLRAA
jgi:single-stranded-DNA-specific exonuclease